MSGNRVNKLSFGYVACLLAVLSISGCALDEVKDRGEKCPPSGSSSTLSYIQMGGASKCSQGDGCYVEVFNTMECPIEFSGCYYDSSAKFYCMAKCPTGQIACDGACVNPDTDLKYCGAQNTCSSSYGCCTGGHACDWWETCQSGHCVDTVCKEGSMRCEDGVTYVCTNKTWILEEECRSNICNEEKTSCSDKKVCNYANRTLSEGKKVCSDDTTQLLVCIDGHMEVDEQCELPKYCQQLDGELKCAEQVYKDCDFNGTTVQHGKAICDGNLLRSCADGFLDGGQSCPLPGEPAKTVCNVDQCTPPASCTLGEETVAHDGLICDGTVLKKCSNGEFEVVEDCNIRSDEAILCRKDACAVPNSCTMKGETVKHGITACNDSNSMAQCVDGEEVVITACDVNETCTDDGCIPKYRTINAILKDYAKIVDFGSCSTGEADVKADVVVEGVVTAMNSVLGFFIQEPSKDGKQSGIYVSCPKNKKCTTYADNTAMAIGDNVRVTSTALNSYYCQIQIYDPAKDAVVEKIDGTAKIEPTVITASDIKDDGSDSASSVYDGSLVRISPVTAVSLVTEQINGRALDVGWKSLDADGKNATVGYMLSKQILTAGHHYDITGVVYYTYNHLLIAPRNADDVVEIKECNADESAVKCMKLSGTDYLFECKDGVLDEESMQDCTKDDKICDSKNNTCRKPVTCTDASGGLVDEGHSGCSSKENPAELSDCVYDLEKEKGVWENTQTCADGCNPDANECFAAAIKDCKFVSLDPDTHKAVVDVVVPEGSDVSVEIRCNKYAESNSTYINKWPYFEAASVNDSCAECDSQTQYVTSGKGLPNDEDRFVCVAIATVKDGKSFVCMPDSGKPVEYSIATKLNSDGMANATLAYAVSRPVLAYWNFDNKTSDVDPSSIKKESTFRLANSTGRIEYMDEGSIAAQIGWSTAAEPDFSRDPYWQVVVNTRGYSKIKFTYLSKASNDKPKSFQVAYKVGDLDFKAVGKVLKYSDNGGIWKTWTDELPQAAESDKITIGIFPFATSNPKIRIDEVKVTGEETKK